MSEPRKNHLSIDGGQVKEDDNVATYKSIPESDTEFRSSKASLSKSKEKVSADGAEEKLLSKEDEAKIVRVDMADAKYVVGDHRNGDAKIELDANKRQFSGLTKEELMKYAEDPFWVNLRWCMFVLFWTMWLAMLAGAVTIIVRAPKCASPVKKQWFEQYPAVETGGAKFSELEDQLANMKSSLVHGIFVEVPTYETEDSSILEQFKAFVTKAKEAGVNVIVDLTPNFVSTSHPWFISSQNKSSEYGDYFIWQPVREYNDDNSPKPPNLWVSVMNTSAWKYSEVRREFYLHHYGEEQPDLNFRNPKVVGEFNKEIAKWVKAGARGVRLNKARELLVNTSMVSEPVNSGRGSEPAADHTTYPFWRHSQTTDFPGLEPLLASFAQQVHSTAADGCTDEKVFTLKEEGSRPEFFLLDRNVSTLRPPSAAPVTVADVTAAAQTITKLVQRGWPFLQLTGSAESQQELALFSMLLPAAPVLSLTQIQRDVNDTALSELAELRKDVSIEHGNHSILAVPAANQAQKQLLACARWKAGHTGYLAVYNALDEPLRANLTRVPTVPPSLAVYLLSNKARAYTNYTRNHAEQADNVLVPAKSTVVLSYVPQIAAES